MFKKLFKWLRGLFRGKKVVKRSNITKTRVHKGERQVYDNSTENWIYWNYLIISDYEDHDYLICDESNDYYCNDSIVIKEETPVVSERSTTYYDEEHEVATVSTSTTREPVFGYSSYNSSSNTSRDDSPSRTTSRNESYSSYNNSYDNDTTSSSSSSSSSSGYSSGSSYDSSSCSSSSSSCD